jgi:competence protein ComEA
MALVDRLGRSQLIAYAAVGVALLIVGTRWLRSTADTSARASDAGPAGSAISDRSAGSGGFSVDDSGGEDVVVDVTGEVRRSGVYRLPSGSRVDDAVARAGGPTGVADLESINLAARLADGQQVAVPARVKSAPGAVSFPGASAASMGQTAAPISIGSATVEQLDTIEGIGPVTAEDIVNFRDQHGGVASVDQLDQISGIGPATMEALRARLQP